MHPPLSPHLHPLCQPEIEKLMTCHVERKWAKFVGVCNGARRELDICLQTEFELKRKHHLEESRRDAAPLIARMEERKKEIKNRYK
jgi:COX assembly protein 2